MFHLFSSLKHGGIIIPLALLVLLDGCVPVPIPHDGWRTAQHRGTVKDAKTGQPIPDATITLQSEIFKEDEALSTKSALDGSFEIGPVTESKLFYFFWLAPFDPIDSCRDLLTVTREGYESQDVKAHAFVSALDGSCGHKIGTHDVILKPMPVDTSHAF